MEKFVVTRKEAGSRFDKYLKKLLPQASSGFLYKMLRKKNITLNEKKAAGNEVIAENDVVKVFFSEETFLRFSGKSGELLEPDRMKEKKGYSVPKSGEDYRKMHFAQQTDKDYHKSYSSRNADRDYQRAFHQFGEIPVIYEDEDILVLNKPVGILSQKAEKEDISLNEWMIGYLLEKKEITAEELRRFRPSVCNRLDRNTSGLVLCGKSVRGSQFLSEMLRNRSLRKYYTAYAQGEIAREITLDGYLKKDEEKNRSRILSEKEWQQLAMTQPEAGKEYKRIETVIRPLLYDEKRDCTKLEILLVTGKSHQIRVHLAGIGHPILGDRKYGWKPRNKGEEAWKYQILHACRIEFPEIEGEFAYLSEKCFEAAMPEFFACLDMF